MENRVTAFVPHESDKIRANRKDTFDLYREYAVLDPANGKSVVTLRIYWPGSVAYACVWVHDGTGAYARGAGRAAGGGYCKASAAAGAALRDAGVTLERDIDGRGLDAIAGAMRALGTYLGVAGAILHVAHA